MYGRITNDGPVGTVVPDADVYTAGATGAINADSPGRPFIVIRAGLMTPGVGPILQQDFSIWVHDVPSTMKRIDDVQTKIRDGALAGSLPVHEFGWWIQACQWRTFGPDAFDDVYKTNTRWSEFTITGRRG